MNKQKTRDKLFKFLMCCCTLILIVSLICSLSSLVHAAPIDYPWCGVEQFITVPESTMVEEFDTESDSWYSEVPEDLREKGSVVKTIDFSDGSVNLYDSLPWDYVDGSYYFDVVKAGQDVLDYINDVSGIDTEIELTDTIARQCPKESCVTSIDGVNVLKVSLMPTVVTQDYCDAFNPDITKWYTDPAGDFLPYGYVSNYAPKSEYPWPRDRKYCVVLEHKETGEIVYMPIGAADAKAHTFPGGVLQTDIQLIKGVDDPTAAVKCNMGDTYSDVISIAYIAQNIGSFKTRPGREKSTISDYLKVCLEIYGGSKSDINKVYKYHIKGFIAWPLGE